MSTVPVLTAPLRSYASSSALDCQGLSTTAIFLNLKPETTMPITPQEALQRTIEHREIFHDEMLHIMRMIMNGELSPVMTAALITGLRVKKETIGEITAAAQVMREFSTKVNVPDSRHLVDIVGTGGDGSHTFNISTCSMLWLLLQAQRQPSMAVAVSAANRAVPMCLKAWVPTSICHQKKLRSVCKRSALVLCLRPTTIPP
jgi:hypothetical protein